MPYSIEERRGRTSEAESEAAQPSSRSKHADPVAGMGEYRSDREESEPLGFPHGWSEEEGQRHAQMVC